MPKITFNLLAAVFFIISVNNILAQQVLLTTGSSWTVPAGVVKIRVEVVGGGGGGSRNTLATYPAGGTGGGGGGAYAMSEWCATPGTTYNYSIGAGGSGSSGANHGGDTWFSSASILLAQGGRGADNDVLNGVAGGTIAASIGTLRRTGGNGGNGLNTDPAGGGGGGAGHFDANGGNGGNGSLGSFFPIPSGGTGGSSAAPGGTGGNGASNIGSGGTGNNYGSGGGGSCEAFFGGASNGGNGAPGAIRITMLTSDLSAGSDVTISNSGDHVVLGGSVSPSLGISYNQNFDGCDAATCNGWTMAAGDGGVPLITATTANGYTPCSGASAKARIRGNSFFAARNTAILTSTASLGNSNGELATLNFNYKCIDYTSGNATAANRCTFTVAWSTNGSTWTDFPTFTNVSSTTCVAAPARTFTPPLNSQVYIRITAVRGSGDFWVVIDDITLTQPDYNYPVTWSGGPIVSNGSTTTPTVNPNETTVYTISTTVDGCPATDNVTVTVTSPLAVTLSDFSASCEDKKILWSTASEQNSSHFVVEQSRNGYEWSQIARVEGAGTTNVTNNYQINDNLSANYYRLKQVDFDGKFEYYKPIHIDCRTETHELTVYPNPTNGTFTVAITSTEKLGESVIFVNDLSGKTVAVRDINILSGTNTVQVENNNLMPGTYIISVKGKEKNTLVPIRLVIR